MSEQHKVELRRQYLEFASVSLILLSTALWLYVLYRPLASVASLTYYRPTPCIVTSALFAEANYRQMPLGFGNIAVRYVYSIGTNDYSGDRWSLLCPKIWTRTDKVKSVIDEWTPGLRTTCFVNLFDPSQSVLRRKPVGKELWIVIYGDVTCFWSESILGFVTGLLAVLGFVSGARLQKQAAVAE